MGTDGIGHRGQGQKVNAARGRGAQRKGASAEREVASFLRDNGLPHADRRGSGFTASDIIGTPGVSWEIKDQDAIRLREWFAQTEEQQTEDGAQLGVLIIKRKGKTNPGDWYAVVTLADLCDLLEGR